MRRTARRPDAQRMANEQDVANILTLCSLATRCDRGTGRGPGDAADRAASRRAADGKRAETWECPCVLSLFTRCDRGTGRGPKKARKENLSIEAARTSNGLVEKTPNPRRAGPPRNPGVQDLVQGKRRWSSPPDPKEAAQGFIGWHERGYLPHRDEPGLTQFVTFRLKDSFPESLRSEWAALLEIEDERDRRKKLEAYLDAGRGESHLRNPDIARIVDGAFQFYHRRRCEMLAWVVMPNHVHALFRITTTSLSALIANWKTYTAREANKKLLRRGGFWAEYFLGHLHARFRT